MRIWEPHIHMISRVTEDYEKMAAAGITHIHKFLLSPIILHYIGTIEC